MFKCMWSRIVVTTWLSFVDYLGIEEWCYELLFQEFNNCLKNPVLWDNCQSFDRDEWFLYSLRNDMNVDQCEDTQNVGLDVSILTDIIPSWYVVKYMVHLYVFCN